MMLRQKKGQAAMEFLMTYGWAILVVLAAIGVLAYFGVMNPGRFIPESCTFNSATGFACLDFTVEQDAAHLYVSNSGGRNVHVYNISVGECMLNVDDTFRDSEKRLFDVTGCSFSSGKLKEEIAMTYSIEGSVLTKTITGSLISEVK